MSLIPYLLGYALDHSSQTWLNKITKEIPENISFPKPHHISTESKPLGKGHRDLYFTIIPQMILMRILTSCSLSNSLGGRALFVEYLAELVP